MLVLEGLDATWRVADVKLSGLRAQQAGVLLGDKLVCIGGQEDTVRGWAVFGVVGAEGGWGRGIGG